MEAQDPSTSELRDLLGFTTDLAVDFYNSLESRPVFPEATVDELRANFGGPLPQAPTPPRQVIAELAAAAASGLVAEPGGRYFGFVIGGSIPAALAADWLTSAWDQNAGLYVIGPAAAVAEEVAGAWLCELFGLPADASYAFVTGGQMANMTALAAARHHVLAKVGWDVEERGLQGAPRIRVVVGEKRHGTIDRALRMLGLGAPTDIVSADDQGRLRAAELHIDDEPTIVCAQAGEVNTGAFDPLAEITAISAAAPNSWVHVDGAFGLWAAVPASLRHLLAGSENADSWSTDAHKWLNVPYDAGVAFTRHADSHRAAFATRASYLMYGESERDAFDWNPESSRRARAFPVYAAIRSLGRSGIEGLIQRCCEHAHHFADGLTELGAEVLNEVVLNQVLFRFGSDTETDAILEAVQRSGEAWMGGTIWAGRRAIRISVSNWQTTAEDVERTLAAYRAAIGGQGPAR